MLIAFLIEVVGIGGEEKKVKDEGGAMIILFIGCPGYIYFYIYPKMKII